MCIVCVLHEAYLHRMYRSWQFAYNLWLPKHHKHHTFSKCHRHYVKQTLYFLTSDITYGYSLRFPYLGSMMVCVCVFACVCVCVSVCHSVCLWMSGCVWGRGREPCKRCERRLQTVMSFSCFTIFSRRQKFTAYYTGRHHKCFFPIDSSSFSLYRYR